MTGKGTTYSHRPYWLPSPEHLVEVALTDGRVVWMRTDITSNGPAQNVVWVNSQDLLMLWRRTPSHQSEIAEANDTSWRADRKFKDAEKGFAAGPESPVPLAEVTLQDSFKALAFINGVTRTIWLLANGANRFPIDLDCDPATYQRMLDVVRNSPPEEASLTRPLRDDSMVEPISRIDRPTRLPGFLLLIMLILSTIAVAAVFRS